MSPLSPPTLVAAVSNNGGLGSIAGARSNRSQLQREIAEVRRRTNRPFAVNLFVPPERPENYTKADIKRITHVLRRIRKRLNATTLINIPNFVKEPLSKLFKEQVQVLLDERVPVFSFTFGRPSADIIKKFKDLKIKIVGTATTPAECVELKRIGCDAICVQGTEAGGHRGSFLVKDKEINAKADFGLFALLSQCRKLVNGTPLIAAGGIMDGQDMVSAIHQGASAIQMGTKFLTSQESTLIPPIHKELLLRPGKNPNNVSLIQDTVLTDIYTGKPARGIYTKLIETFNDIHSLPWDIQSQFVGVVRHYAARINHTDYMQLWAGKNYAKAEDKPVKRIIQDILEEAEKFIRR
ncbi:unnamed protein product [Didymodactylos carnosus]|uniref:2-nitropropane dioxygenase n=1 Tax=Didymodactylos carnosus TaxID=1234261 RepID=A0A814KTB2_9BILA|nr:unnamed protein product [Didymodactylos carnosus]CAF1055616.1 unnamed protein product [Didymodactylos carnosus]CAF3673239.1 unnamed protein product [Didymodactylos carnosus]CAF3824673.1 unnamed protein product [Didymodactylos carnosus]